MKCDKFYIIKKLSAGNAYFSNRVGKILAVTRSKIFFKEVNNTINLSDTFIINNSKLTREQFKQHYFDTKLYRTLNL